MDQKSNHEICLEGLYSDQAWEEGRDVPDIHPAGFGILPDIRPEIRHPANAE